MTFSPPLFLLNRLSKNEGAVLMANGTACALWEHRCGVADPSSGGDR